MTIETITPAIIGYLDYRLAPVPKFISDLRPYIDHELLELE